MVVDAHHHLWRYHPARQSWLRRHDELAPLQRDFLGDELNALIRENGIDATIVVQADDSLDDTDAMVSAAKEHAFIAGIVGWAPLHDPHATQRTLDAYVDEPKIKGLRHMFIFDRDPDWLIRPNILDSLEIVAARGYTWDSTATTSRHLQHVCTLAERIPNLKQVIDHLGKPPVLEGGWEPWASLMQRAAECPNIYVKLSAPLKVTAISNVSGSQLRRYVDHVIDHFGPERVMIASNWPVCTLFSGYRSTWHQMVDLLADLTPAQRSAVMGGTAMDFYKLA